ncbi:MAG: FAD-dependent oxidoreductase [Gordonia sp. (in: high G+C Gram-positive bacteria)]
MPYVITQSCCNDASCVSACPVNCIHPTPDEPEFATADMLYIDPETCIDCGACIEVCPVDAIAADEELEPDRQIFGEINAGYYTDHEVDTPPALPVRKVSLPADRRLRVAVVGAGPAGFYAAEELLKYAQISVDMFDRLPTPYGLVRAGVAPDHRATKGVDKVYAAVAARRAFTYHLGIEVGRHIEHADLAERYGAVIYAHGASTGKDLHIAGEHLPGSVAAPDFVAWYNGHPDHAEDVFDFSTERAVIIGNGNVALDIARVLLTDPDSLSATDIADHALAALRDSRIREVVIVARRGAAQAAFTIGEFIGIGGLPDVDVVIDTQSPALDPVTAQAQADGSLDSTVAAKLRLVEEYAGRTPVEGRKRVVFRFWTSPLSVTGSPDTGVVGVECVANTVVAGDPGCPPRIVAHGDPWEIPAGLVVHAIGYTGRPLRGVPFDTDRGVVPNDEGRVLDSPGGAVVPGVYVAGWIKRGATGGIGVNRRCGTQTARAVVADFAAGTLAEPGLPAEDIDAVAAANGATVVTAAGWQRIDAAEVSAGRVQGRPRRKLVRFADLLAAVGEPAGEGR